MRGLWFAVVLAFGAGCGATPESDERVDAAEGAIVNGTIDNGDPAVVYIDVGCTGTLVTSRIVLTACHCLSGVGYDPSVFFGTDADGQGTWIDTTHHAVYPGNCTGDGDLAMMTLAEAGPAMPIPINDRDLAPYVGQPVRVAGFGVTSENGGGSGVKRHGMSTLDQVDGGTMYCDPTQTAGTCYGDSGGPNFMLFEGVEYVVGTTSYGTSACGSGLDASARTDTYAGWLEQYIDTHDPSDCGADGACASFCDAPDPDCPCANDGHCTAACPDVASDPDCTGCGADGQCRQDCPVLDDDCCIGDGNCVEACAALDPDCGPDEGSGSGSGQNPGSGSGGGLGGPHRDDAGEGGLVGSVVCTARAPGRDDGGISLVILAALGALCMRRRR